MWVGKGDYTRGGVAVQLAMDERTFSMRLSVEKMVCMTDGLKGDTRKKVLEVHLDQFRMAYPHSGCGLQSCSGPSQAHHTDYLNIKYQFQRSFIASHPLHKCGAGEPLM